MCVHILRNVSGSFGYRLISSLRLSGARERRSGFVAPSDLGTGLPHGAVPLLKDSSGSPTGSVVGPKGDDRNEEQRIRVDSGSGQEQLDAIAGSVSNRVPRARVRLDPVSPAALAPAPEVSVLPVLDTFRCEVTRLSEPVAQLVELRLEQFEQQPIGCLNHGVVEPRVMPNFAHRKPRALEPRR